MLRDRSKPIAWSAVVAVISTLVVWSFTLGGRLSAVETKASAVEQRVTRVEDRYQQIDTRLSRIEGKLDRAIEREGQR